MTGRGYTHVPSAHGDYEHRDEEQKEAERLARVSVLRSTLTFAQTQKLSPVETIELAEMLGLGTQLDELVGNDPKRHRRLTDLRRELGFSSDELDDRAAEGTSVDDRLLE